MTTFPLTLPGRLGDPDMALRDDPRADPRMIAALTAVGLGGPAAPPAVGPASPLEQQLAYVAAAEAGFEAVFGALSGGLPPIAGVARSTETIKGVDGNDISLFVHRPTGAAGPLPGLLHIHGGGMVILAAASEAYAGWRDELAATGMVVVGVEFRNGAGRLGPHPFPAGLNDCVSALRWIAENKAALGVGKLVVSGESGGGNLTLATALKAKRDGLIGAIDGVYAQCPYISNAYGAPPPSLPSLVENDGYVLDGAQMAVMAKLYDPTGAHVADPLAWPLFADPDDLAGLPPHVISVNELDPLRDEGLAYFRKLLDAGVNATSRTVNGTSHAGDVMFAAALPDVRRATIRDIKGFADSL
jgi:acetyl esterase/lipase